MMDCRIQQPGPTAAPIGRREMLPTQLMRNHAGKIQGTELDQLLVFLYQTFRDHQDGQPQSRFQEMEPGERMESFRTWLEQLMAQENPPLDDWKIQWIFQKELPGLRQAWRDIMLPGAEISQPAPGLQYEMEVRDILEPEDWAGLGGTLSGQMSGPGRLAAAVLVEDGLLFRNLSLSRIRESALRKLGRPGVMVQAALRNLTDITTGEFTDNLELVVCIRRTHEADIRAAIVRMELDEQARDMDQDLAEYHRVSTGP